VWEKKIKDRSEGQLSETQRQVHIGRKGKRSIPSAEIEISRKKSGS